MKGIGIIVAMALLNAGLSKAGDYTATNNVPEKIHNLMDSEDYAFDQKHFILICFQVECNNPRPCGDAAHANPISRQADET